MKYVEIVASAGSADTIQAIADKAKAQDFRVGVEDEGGMQQMRMLVGDDRLQELLDTLQHILGAQPTARIVVMAVEATLPRSEEEEVAKKRSVVAARESIYEGAEKNASLDSNYLVLVLLSTMVAAIGLIENNVAVVIGAMVIAPLLGPNLALSLGTALGDLALMKKAVKTLLAGILLAVAMSVAIGWLWPQEHPGTELLTRTTAGLDSVVLALASGAAAALSLTTGLSSVLVGVMVSVALLPPAATLGIMLGQGNTALAAGAGLLLAVNIVSVNLASKIVFLARNIYPRTWLEKEKAKRGMRVYITAWLVTLVLLMIIIYARQTLG